MKTWEANSVLFFLPTIWRLDALKRREEITLEHTFVQKKKTPGLKLNPGLALIGLPTTEPWALKLLESVRVNVGFSVLRTDGRLFGRCTVQWLKNFLGWVDLLYLVYLRQRIFRFVQIRKYSPNSRYCLPSCLLAVFAMFLAIISPSSIIIFA